MKKSKQALLHSVIALVLCVSMLVGSTFAWFTDGVSTGKNVIASGNLDIVLEYLDGNGQWQAVTEETALFRDDALWEPGYTEVVYLRLRNAGDLALKYRLGVNVVSETGSVNAQGESFQLSDFIRMGTVPGRDTRFDSRSDARNNIRTNTLISQGYAQEGTMEKGAQDEYLALVVFMPEGVGNEANHRTGEDAPRIQLGIELVATQMESESDSFDNSYDAAAGFPVVHIPDGGKSDVTVSGGAVASDVTISGQNVSASVPAGVQVEDGVSEMTLSVTEKTDSGSNVTLADAEVMKALDVHVSGVAEGNTTPITVTLQGFAAKGLNEGNLKLYHVENGVTNAMVYVPSVNDFTAHNQFAYDPATGDVTLYMASFSEVALVADTENAWEGNVAAFSSGSGTEKDPYIIANADQFVYFGDLISNDNDNYGSAHYKLTADLNFGGEANVNKGLICYPVGYHAVGGTVAAASLDDAPETYYIIEEDTKTPGSAAADDSTTWYTYGGSFKGTFDGAGHSISNIYQNTWSMKGNYSGNYWNAAMGLFGYVNGGTVKNLTVDNFSSDGEFTPTGVIAAYACDSTFENIAITSCNPRVYNTGNGGIVGIGGNSDDPDSYKLTFKNITIDNTNKISALWGSWDVACGGLVGMFRGAGHVYMTNCHVAAQIDVYNDVCGNYQYYWYRYAGMLVGTNKNMVTENGYTMPETSKFHAENCTVHFGEWNDYYYCELVANSLASYTHDHQFSRLTQVDSVDTEAMTVTVDGKTTAIPTSGRVNYVVVNGESVACYHFMDGKEHSHEDYNGDGVEDYQTVNGESVLVEDKQHVYLPFNQLFTGYGWGVKHVPIYDDGTPNPFGGVTILDRVVADSVIKFETKFDGDFLYRVGNGNAVQIGNLFGTAEGVADEDISDSGVYVTIDKVDKNAQVSGTFTANTSDWTKGTVKFSGTGVVKLTIQDYDYCTPTVLYLEVVDGNNVANQSEWKNDVTSVLVCDVALTSEKRITGNKTLFGNGFTVDATAAPYSGVNYDSESYVIYLENSSLNNVIIQGMVYPEVGGTRTNDYYRALVMTNGDCKISDCFLANTASPIRNGGNLELVNSVLKGGAYANMDIRNGHTILDNVTTINQLGEGILSGDKEIVGLGVVVYQEGGTEDLKITIRNGLTQHNVISEAQAASFSGYAKTFVETIFAKFGEYQGSYDSTNWVNTGIISMNNYFTPEDLVDERTDKAGYFATAKEVTVLAQTRNCVAYSYKPTTGNTSSNIKPEAGDQSTIAPTAAFDFTSKNYAAKEEGSNDYCYEDGGIVYISMDEGDTFTWDPSILTVTKNAHALPYTVSLNGADYTDKAISFNASGDYEVKYSYTDPYNYTNSGTYSVAYEKTLTIQVVVVKAAAKNAVFSFGANGTAYSSKTAVIGDKTYVMPDVTATVDGKIGSTTVNGVKVYYPITEMYTSDGKTEHSGSWYACFPIFKDAVQIVDYTGGGTGEAVTYNQTTVTAVAQIPATLKATNPTTAFLYQMNATNYPPPTTPYAVSGAVCYTSNQSGLTASNTRTEFTITAEYTYTDNAGTVYYYYVGYHCAEQTNGCVTPDTLITLADGSQVRVDQLKGDEQLLVWNLESGKLDSAPILFVDSEAEKACEIVHLYFSDGTDVKVIAEHGFWDYDLNRYVYLDRNAEQYVGHTFAKQNGDQLAKVKLVDVVLETEVTSAWSPVTEGHLCYFVNGMLSMPGGVAGLFNIFDVDARTMTYDYAAMAEDIETYGLFTYEELNAIAPLSKEMFDAAGGAYLKISIGKGNLTMDELIYMIERYSKYFD